MQKHKLEVKHTCIKINNYELGDLPSTEKFFSIWDPVRFQAFPKGIKYDQETKTLYLPRGASIPRLEKDLGVNAFIDQSHDPVQRVNPIMLRYMPRDDIQKQGIQFLLGKGEYEYTTRKSQLSVNLGPGDGKTYLSVAAAAYYGVRMAMITSAGGWIEQWAERIQEYTDTTREEIYIIKGKPSIVMLLNGVHDISKYKFVLCSHNTLKSYGDKNGWDKIGDLFKMMGIGLKICDEAHLYFDNICSIDFATDTLKTIYLTATPARSDRNEDKIYQAAFSSVPGLDLFDDERDPRTHYVAFHYSSNPSPIDVQRCRGAYGFLAIKYIDYVVKRPNFYELLFILLEIAKTKGKTLIYIGKVDAIYRVYNWIMYNFPELNGMVGMYHSRMDPDIKEAEKEKLIILSTIKSCGAATDIKGLQLTINLANPFSSNVIARQTLGRTRDKGTMYIDVVDTGFATLRGYYKHKQGIFSKYALDFRDVILRKDMLHEKYMQMFANKMEWYNKLYSKDSDKKKKVMHLV